MSLKLLPKVAFAKSLLTASAATALVFTIGCNYSEDGKPPADPAFATTQVRTFSAAGSTFIAPLMFRWSADYQKLTMCGSTTAPLGAELDSVN